MHCKETHDLLHNEEFRRSRENIPKQADADTQCVAFEEYLLKQLEATADKASSAHIKLRTDNRVG